MLTEGWRRTVDAAKSDLRWDLWDAVIRAEVLDYQTRLGLGVDWRIFKAQIWTESGASSPAWLTRPMQIGNAGDPGYATMRDHREHADAIMSDQVKAALDGGDSINNPKLNIQVGLAYAYMKLSDYDTVVTDKQIRTYSVVRGDALERIAHTLGTTQKNLIDLNPQAANGLRVGQKLSYQSAEIRPVGCMVNAARLQTYYNGNGDPNYAEKITYCLQIILNLKR
jgi:hypothetical protein